MQFSIHTKSSESVDNIELSKSQDLLPFAAHHFLWRPGEYSWNEAHSMCGDIGMNLASITSTYEYNIVRGLLMGQGTTKYEHWLLTPCRLETTVCLVFLGLHVDQVSYLTTLLS